PERLVLPTDRPYPLVADHRGARVVVEWPAGLQRGVARVAREHHVTSFMVVQAALAVLLARLSASSEVAVGFSIAGRRDPVLDGLVGFFINYLVLRVELAGDPTVAELLGQVRGRSLAAYEHQDVPFEVLVERLNPARSLTHHPLVQVVLAWQNLPGHTSDPAAGVGVGDLQVTPVPVDTQTARMDLVFSLGERWSEVGEPAGIGGAVEFRTDVFDAASIEALIARLQKVVVALTAEPTRRLSSIDVLDEAERARLEGWGNRAVLTQPAPTPVSVPGLWAAQVARSPAGVALVCGERSWTYREVEQAANRLAHLLAGQGVGAGDVVALLLERSAQAIIAILAVLKTGAAYVPVDPEHPDAPLAFILADAAPVAAVTTSGLADRLDGCELVVVDVEDPRIRSCPGTGLPAPAADNIAYLIYTSGTTGTPKGVAVTHTGIADLVASHVERLAITPESRVLQFAPLMFDMSVGNMWWALLSGAAAVIPTEDEALPGQELIDLMARHHVSHAKFTPSTLAALPAEQLCGLTLVTGGEVCPAALVDRYGAVATLVNEYGPTETTVDVTIGYPVQGGSGTPA
ncbi:MAG: AMP-binding protein, partial [Mycobacterium sp.]